MAVSEEQAYTQLDRVSEIGFRHVLFAGGELSLWKPFVSVVAHARALGLKSTWITNGTSFSIPLKSYDLLDGIIVSWDRMHEEAIAQKELRSARDTLLLCADALPDMRLGVNTVISQRDIMDSSLVLSISDSMRSFASRVSKWNIHPLYSHSETPSQEDFRKIVFEIEQRSGCAVVDNFPYVERRWPVVRTNDEVHVTYTDTRAMSRNAYLGQIRNPGSTREALIKQGFLQ